MSSRTRASSPSHIHYERMIWDMLCLGDLGYAIRIVDTLYLIPISIPEIMTIDRLANVTSTNDGNIRLGLYRDNGGIPDGGALVVEGGPQAAVAGKNEVAIPNTQLLPGLYWLANNHDNGALSYALIDTFTTSFGTYQGAGVAFPFGPMPNPCPVTVSGFRVPIGYVRVVSIP